MPFRAGQSGNPAGKPKGTVSKLNRDIKEMILGALIAAGGENYLLRQSEQNPVAFLGLVGKVLPLQLAGHDGGRLEVEFRWADAPAPLPVLEAKAEPVADETTSETVAVTFLGEC